MDTGNFSRMLM